MALIDDLLKGNPLTGIAIGIGAYLLAPTIGQLLRPAAKAAIKGGILVYQGLAQLGDMGSDVVAEARSELEQPAESATEPSLSTRASRRSAPGRTPSET
jgi:hypothetical protein